MDQLLRSREGLTFQDVYSVSTWKNEVCNDDLLTGICLAMIRIHYRCLRLVAGFAPRSVAVKTRNSRPHLSSTRCAGTTVTVDFST